MKLQASIIVGIFAIGLFSTVPDAFSQTQTTIIPLSDEINLEKTTTIMSVPQGNTLPWGFVKGKIAEPVERYPVIIQFFKGDDPVHVAQVDVKGDGSYEYKFRVRNLDTTTGEFVNIFEGDYTVKIFKVIPNTDQRA